MKKNEVGKYYSTSQKIFLGTLCAVLGIYALTILVTLFWGLMTSFKSVHEYNRLGNILGLPTGEVVGSQKWSLLVNYKTIIESLTFSVSTSYYSGQNLIKKSVEGIGFFGLLWNTIIYTVAGAGLTTLMPCLVSYIVSKYDFKFSGVIYWFVIITMSIPNIGTYPSELAMLRRLQLYDTFLGFILQKSHFLGMYFLVYYAFWRGIPDSYIEAAEVDGASQLRVLVQVMLPMAAKILASVFLLQFVTFWNDYHTAILYMPTHPTLAWGVWQLTFNLNSAHLNPAPVRVAGSMLLALPITILFIAFKDKLMGNVSMGGLKG